MSSIQVQTPPAAEPVDLVTLKNHLRVTITNDDALIKLYLQSARELVESESGRSLVNKLYRQSHDRFPRLHDCGDFGTGYFYQAPRYARGHHYDDRQVIKLLRCPLVSVEKITYIDLNGAVQTLLPTPALWQPDTEYELGDQFQDLNGNLQEVTAVAESGEDGSSSSGSTAPAWGNTVGAITSADGDLTEKCIAVPAPAGDFLVDSDSEPPRIYPNYGAFWPATLRVPNAVQIFLTAGYGDDASSAPATLKVAIMQSTGVMYQNREAMTAEQLRALDWYDRLIWSERVIDYAPTR
jgi:hypothetical protein